MYSVAVKRDLVAQHFLIGGDWGDENLEHSHHYFIELQLAGEQLDRHGYMVDIVEIEAQLNVQVAYYRDKTLNELPEFEDLNPSIENFSRILCEELSSKIPVGNVHTISVKIWENDIAWASYQLHR